MGLRFDFPDLWIFTAPLFAFEVQDIGNTDILMTFQKRLHLGGEAKITRHFAARLGLNQGYFTAGFGIDLPVFKLDISTYSAEIGSNAGQVEDRRVQARMAFEI